MNVVTSILSGALGGLAATSLGTIIVRWFFRPTLEFDEGVVKWGSSPHEERIETAEYKIQIRNTGRSAATNCKPRITLEGVHETTISEPVLAERGHEFTDFDITKTYTMTLIPTWEEEGSPNRIDINQDEYASFRLMKATTERVGPQIRDDIRFGSVLPEEEMQEKDTLFSTPIRVETPPVRTNTEPDVSYQSSLDRETFEEIDWKTKEIIVTSANGKKLHASIDFGWEQNTLPEVSLVY